ncbi:sugar ABC transporter substrate-binding protein [Nocardioides panacihumi]|uniref:Sugar ABC transporter substrate-binding protein n=1 Tax=Nocardioides panacihumi TaxID=400774 RepID=A0ABN2RKX0_9ACTN
MNRRRTQRWVAAGAALLASTTLAACGNSSDGSSASGGNVTLSYALWDPNQAPAMKQIAAAFEKKNPGIHVDVQITPGQQFFTKLQTAVTAGNAPDVFWTDPIFFQMYAANGALKAQDGAGVDTSKFPDQLVSLCQSGGKLYGVPKDFDTIGVWYNKSLFDAAGVAYPKDDWTWADFQSAAAKLTDKGKGIFGTAAELNNQQTYYNTIYQAGGSVLNADKTASTYTAPETVQGLKFWTDLVDKGYSPSIQQMTDTSPMDMFQTGKVAMVWEGSWNVKPLSESPVKDHIDVAALPRGAKQATMINGLCNVVSATTKHPAAAEKFLTFLGSEAAQRIQGESGTVIPAYNGTQKSWVDAYPKYHVQAYVDQVPSGVPMPVTANTFDWMQNEPTILGKAWAGQVSVDDAAAQMAKTIDDSIAKNKG